MLWLKGGDNMGKYGTLRASLDISDFSKLTYKELREATSTLSRVANKRVERLENRGFKNSIAYANYSQGKSGGKRFGIKNKNRQEIEIEYRRLRNFLNSKSSTVAGAKSERNKVLNTLGLQNENITDEEYNQITEALSRLYDSNRLRDNKDISGKVAKVVKMYADAKRLRKATSENIYNDVMSLLKKELLESGIKELEQLNNNSQPEYSE